MFEEEIRESQKERIRSDGATGRRLNKFFNDNVNMWKVIIGVRVLLGIRKVEATYGKELAFTPENLKEKEASLTTVRSTS